MGEDEKLKHAAIDGFKGIKSRHSSKNKGQRIPNSGPEKERSVCWIFPVLCVVQRGGTQADRRERLGWKGAIKEHVKWNNRAPWQNLDCQLEPHSSQPQRMLAEFSFLPARRLKAIDNLLLKTMEMASSYFLHVFVVLHSGWPLSWLNDPHSQSRLTIKMIADLS